MNNDSTYAKSLAHTKWNCKYHIVFAAKYRRKVFFEDKRLATRDIIRRLCAWKRDYRRRDLSRSCKPYVKHTAEDEYIIVYGVLKGQEQYNDISEVWQDEICI